MRITGAILRRLAILVLFLTIAYVAGFSQLLLRWSGSQGAPPNGNLYVLGDFAENRLVARLSPAPEDPDDRERFCYQVETPATGTEGSARACRGRPARFWVEDALLEISVGARGTPRLSIAGLRLSPGDWLGSLADPRPTVRPRPRYPLRGYGIPGLAAQRVDCEPVREAGEPPVACLRSNDRLGRLAVVRAADDRETVDRPGFEEQLRLHPGEVLWSGLVPFRVSLEETVPDQAPRLGLERIDRLRSRQVTVEPKDGELQTADERDTEEGVPERGGDRRWLGRLWPVEVPEPGDLPRSFEIWPMQSRYTPYHLSRQRTHFEGEDVLQRLIDGGWLCLENGGGDPRTRQVVWRPLYAPGCEASAAAPPSFDDLRAPPVSAWRDYDRARSGELAFLADRLIGLTNAALAQGSYLEDPTALPLAFDWHLALPAASTADELLIPQPAPAKLWGVRFGTTRQVRQTLAGTQGQRPEIRPRSSTARHVIQALRGQELLASFYLPHRESGGRPSRGSICLGRHRGDVSPYRASSGDHHPLGAVAFEPEDPLVGTWSADPDVPCRGCQLSLAVAGDLDGENRLTFAAAGDCASLEVPGVALGEADWRSAQALRWRDLSLRHVVRNEPPWLAVTDPATGRRYFAGEFYQRGGLEPLLGDASGLSGVEAALSRYLEDGAEISAPPAMELSIDGDLQLAATAIVRHRAKNVLDERPEEPESVPVTAVILDAMTGEVLAAVNASASASSRSHRGEELVPTAWSLGSGQVQRGENAAFLRRRALGSTMKIAGAYALVNNGLEPGSEIARRQPGIAFQESSASGDGAIFIDDVSRRRELEEGRRLCSTGPHLLPAGDAGFTEGTFVRRFAQSCNNFFVLTGFRHAGSRPARFSEWRRSQSPEALPDELVVDVRRPTEATLFQPAFGLQPLVDRIRDGLADDFAAGEPRIPMSYFGILFRLGFQPRPKLFEAGGTVAAELTFEHDGQEVRVPLAHGWFASPDAAVPALRPGRDFSYPAVPSPGRLDEATRSRPVTETYDDKMEAVGRLDDDGKWADVQYAMLQIGQSNIEISALGLASLYAPAARSDGRAVRPCLFRAGCGEERRGEQVLDVDRAAVLNRALRAVISSGGTAWARSREPVLAPLREGGWGGKTGTYQVARRNWPRGFSQADWWRLRAWACGVEGAGRPALPAELDKLRNPKIAGLVAELTSADRGSALGARACEDPSWPLNPAGVQGYNPGGLPESLDRFAEGLRRARGDGIPTVYHSFVAVALPPREGEAEAADPAAGLVVAVMVDRETPGDQKIAVEIGAELALAAGRWATLAR